MKSINEHKSGWIWIDKTLTAEKHDKELVLFRKELILNTLPEQLELRVSADAKYKLFINGSLVNVGPQKGDNHIWYYDTIDVRDFLRKGSNIFVTQVMKIPAESQAGNASFFRTETPGFYLTGSGWTDTSLNMYADSTWEYKIAPVQFKKEHDRFAPLQILEEATGTLEHSDIFSSSFDLDGWEHAVEYAVAELAEQLRPDNLVERTIPLMEMKTTSFTGVEKILSSRTPKDVWDGFLGNKNPITIAPQSREIIEISAGTENTGFLNLHMAGGTGAEITILTSECYAYDPDEDLDGFFMPKKGDRTDSRNGKLFGFTDTYRVFGNGNEHTQEIYQPFWFRTFRYIQLIIETSDQPLTLKSFTFTTCNYPLVVESSVETSDPTLKGIWEISERTLRLCMHETYEDCPFYEQLQYVMDSRNQILYTYAVSADDRLARQCMDDYRRSVKADGLVNCSYPNFEHHIIPGFTIYYIGMVYDHMMYFGDHDLIRSHVPVIQSILKFFHTHCNASGLVDKIGGPLFMDDYWSFIDWTPQWRETMGVPPATLTGPITMESLLYILGLQYAAALLEFIGEPGKSENYLIEAEKVQEAVNRECRGNNGMYQDGPNVNQYSQHTQVFALLTNTIDTERGRVYLLETLNNRESFAQCSVAMMYYLFRALEKCNLYEKTDELWDTWRDMIRKNLTTCEEDSVLSRSDCHAWGALALYELPSVILGVRPGAPGYAELEIRPTAGHLDWARGSVKTPKGLVDIEWEKGDKRLQVKAKVPSGISVSKNSITEIDIS